MMTDFPQGGDIGATRAWLDKEGYVGLFTGWEADALLRTSEEDVKSRFGSSPEDQRRADMLWGLLDTARRSPQPQAAMQVQIRSAAAAIAATKAERLKLRQNLSFPFGMSSAILWILSYWFPANGATNAIAGALWGIHKIILHEWNGEFPSHLNINRFYPWINRRQDVTCEQVVLDNRVKSE